MITLEIPSQFLTDERLQQLRAEGWTVKCPRFINGNAVFPAVKRG